MKIDMSKRKHAWARIGITFLGGALAFLVGYGVMYLLGVEHIPRCVYAGMYGVLCAGVGWIYMQAPDNTELDDGE